MPSGFQSLGMRTNPKDKERAKKEGGEAVSWDPEARIQGRAGVKPREWRTAVGMMPG